MDAFADLLNGARARGALFNQTVLDPPWSLRICDGAPLALATMIRGHAWVVPDDSPPALMRTGDVAIMRGPAPYTIADDPATPPQIVIHSGCHYTTVEGRDLGSELTLGIRTCGESSTGSALVVSGTYQVQGDVSGRLLAALPPVLVVPEEDSRGPLMDLVVAEINKDEPGQQVVLDRLLDLALIATLRAWFARPEARAPAWYRAQCDPVVGRALRSLHDRPADPWTVATLADRAGVSRATFARRFTALLGEPPMSYLTDWRIALAADLLRETDATVESIARQVGYANAFALSVAFKRVRGLSPSRHRALAG
ncbi:MAG: AraC family transcriptional regulator [Pseudonocardiales bacterium]|nr:MAG: AraC family transcriptional regulator [Pseudonocardiales bacterium]